MIALLLAIASAQTVLSTIDFANKNRQPGWSLEGYFQIEEGYGKEGNKLIVQTRISIPETFELKNGQVFQAFLQILDSNLNLYDNMVCSIIYNNEESQNWSNQSCGYSQLS